MTGLSSILKSAAGDYEWTRVLGAFGVLVFILVASGLELYEVWWLGKSFDLVAWCTAFPAGLAAAVAAIGTTAAFKDKTLAQARATQAGSAS